MKSNNICCVYTIYALFLYLINVEDEELDSTFYIIDTTIPPAFKSRLKHCWLYYPPHRLTGKWWIDWIPFRWHIFRTLPRLNRSSKLYMQDHKPWTAVYSGNHGYTYIEDSPQHISYMFNSEKNNWYTEILSWNRLKICQFLYGSTFYESFAHHPLAKRLLLTEDEHVPFLKGRERIFSLPFKTATWKSFSEYKRKRILEIFDVSNDDIEIFQNADTLIITQPLCPDSVSIDIHADIYKKLISKYNEQKVVIKTHPRDKFNYSSLYPNVKVFSKPLPLQLLLMIGMKIKTAATIYSTAVMQLPKSIDIHWYGTEFDNRLFVKVGHFPEPKGITPVKC